ncbi:hypothetical protein BJX66DRAFT_340440 [Aspergillus keveii]|uniref:Zn(2)-C6 fungal-type domain-containing protein n=1 Tax=Aspergillus keveii TaxID=714993 RepID=A0ABR4FYG9_9EURO
MASRATTQACELCRRRKVKCDGLPTCTNCHFAEAPCHYPPPKKRGPKTAQFQDVTPPGETLNSPSPATDVSARAEIGVAPPTARNPYSCPASSSPASYSTATNALFASPEIQIESAIRVHLDLLAGLHVATPSETAVSIANHCILLYTQYVFGTVPMCHEATLRVTTQRFFVLPSSIPDSAENQAWIFQCLAAGSGNSETEPIKALRNLTLLTALCAAVTYVVPESLVPTKHLTAPLFLRAARNMLSIYEDYDLEHPDSSSLTIRMFLSSAIQIATGSRGVAFHILNEACLIAMRMHLYDESAVQGQDPVEETILRNAFWQLYVCDKTVLVVKGRPVTIHEPLFESELTLQIRSQRPVSLFDHGHSTDNNINAGVLEDCLLDGFHVIRRLWTMAARVIQAVESTRERSWDAYPHPRESSNRAAQLSEAYFEMITLTNNPPLWTQSVQDSPRSSSGPTSMDKHLSDILQRQRTSYLITLHSIKVFVLSAVVEGNMTEIIGLSTEPLALAMRQVEQAQDFLNVLESVPFLHLQAEGEQCTSRHLAA